MQKTLIAIGVLLVVLGLLWPVVRELGLGRLPEDVVIEKGNFRLYFPITTMLIISVVITIVVWLIRR